MVGIRRAFGDAREAAPGGALCEHQQLAITLLLVGVSGRAGVPWGCQSGEAGS